MSSVNDDNLMKDDPEDIIELDVVFKVAIAASIEYPDFALALVLSAYVCMIDTSILDDADSFECPEKYNPEEQLISYCPDDDFAAVLNPFFLASSLARISNRADILDFLLQVAIPSIIDGIDDDDVEASLLLNEFSFTDSQKIRIRNSLLNRFSLSSESVDATAAALFASQQKFPRMRIKSDAAQKIANICFSDEEPAMFKLKKSKEEHLESADEHSKFKVREIKLDSTQPFLGFASIMPKLSAYGLLDSDEETQDQGREELLNHFGYEKGGYNVNMVLSGPSQADISLLIRDLLRQQHRPFIGISCARTDDNSIEFFVEGLGFEIRSESDFPTAFALLADGGYLILEDTATAWIVDFFVKKLHRRIHPEDEYSRMVCKLISIALSIPQAHVVMSLRPSAYAFLKRMSGKGSFAFVEVSEPLSTDYLDIWTHFVNEIACFADIDPEIMAKASEGFSRYMLLNLINNHIKGAYMESCIEGKLVNIQQDSLMSDMKKKLSGLQKDSSGLDEILIDSLNSDLDDFEKFSNIWNVK